MDFIKHAIKLKRPNLREVSVKNYANFLNRLSKLVEGHELKSLKFLKNIKKVIFYLDEMTFNSMRSTLTSIIVALDATDDIFKIKPEYDTLFAKAKIVYDKKLTTNKKSAKTSSNWTTLGALLKKQKALAKEVKNNHIADKQGLTTKNQKLLQNYLIASLYTLTPPRRNIYATVQMMPMEKFKKLKEDVLSKNNYLVFTPALRKIFFYFGIQKSQRQAEHYAKQTLPPKLFKVLKMYVFFNANQKYMLRNNRGGPYTSTGLSIKVKELLGIGSTMIRKIYITEKTKESHDLIEATANAMGHSVGMAKAAYLKNDD